MINNEFTFLVDGLGVLCNSPKVSVFSVLVISTKTVC